MNNKITFEELRTMLKDPDGNPFSNFTLEDYDGNSIDSTDLYILDAYAMRDWLVTEININTIGHLRILMNSGNFKEHHFRNVY